MRAFSLAQHGPLPKQPSCSLARLLLQAFLLCCNSTNRVAANSRRPAATPASEHCLTQTTQHGTAQLHYLTSVDEWLCYRRYLKTNHNIFSIKPLIEINEITKRNDLTLVFFIALYHDISKYVLLTQNRMMNLLLTAKRGRDTKQRDIKPYDKITLNQSETFLLRNL